MSRLGLKKLNDALLKNFAEVRLSIAGHLIKSIHYKN